jgi:hypothetical protein
VLQNQIIACNFLSRKKEYGAKNQSREVMIRTESFINEETNLTY